jgi:tRNA/tmRNA/rRNA uracil-C5-methylase (TrmA/RlmC/RlmD family)
MNKINNKKNIMNPIIEEKKRLKEEALKKINNNKEEVKKINKKDEEKILEKKKEIRTKRYIKGARREEMLNYWSYSLVRCNNEACKGYTKSTNRDKNACYAIGKVGIKKLLNKDIGNYKREQKEKIIELYENN